MDEPRREEHPETEEEQPETISPATDDQMSAAPAPDPESSLPQPSPADDEEAADIPPEEDHLVTLPVLDEDDPRAPTPDPSPTDDDGTTDDLATGRLGASDDRAAKADATGRLDLAIDDAPTHTGPRVDDAAWATPPPRDDEPAWHAAPAALPEPELAPRTDLPPGETRTATPFAARSAADGPRADSTRTASPPPADPPARNSALPAGCGGFTGGVILGALIGAVFSSLFVLLLLYGLNGTLNFSRSQAVLDLQSQASRAQRESQQLSGQVGDLEARTGEIEGRTQQLERLPGEIDQVRSRTGALEQKAGELDQSVTALDEQVTTLEGEMDEVRDLTATFDGFLTNLRDLLVETKPLPTPTVTETPHATRTPRSTATPRATATPRTTTTPEPTRTPTTPQTATPPAASPTPEARIAPRSGAPGDTFTLTVTDLAPNTEYVVTLSNPAASVEQLDTVTTNAAGRLTLDYSTTLPAGSYRVSVRPADDEGAAPVAESDFVVRQPASSGSDGGTASPQLALNPSQLRAGQSLTIRLSGAMVGRPVTVELRTPGGNLLDRATRSPDRDGALEVTYDAASTSLWSPGEWTVTLRRAGAADITATFTVAP